MSEQSGERNAGLWRLREAVAETLADERCARFHPEDGGTCCRCREWAGVETRAMFDRYVAPSPTGTEATTARIAEVLAEHEPKGFSCACGWRNETATYATAHRAHVTAVLSAGVIRDMQAAAWDEGKTAHARQQLDIAYGRARQFSDPINPYHAVSIGEGA